MNIQMTDEDLELVPTEDAVCFCEETGLPTNYPVIHDFDGRVCDFGDMQGNGCFKIISISKPPTVKMNGVATLTIMKDWAEFDITDDWGTHHYLYIRKTESDVIFKAILSYKEVYNIVPVLK